MASEMTTAISSAWRATILTEFFIAVTDEIHQLQAGQKKVIRVRKCELGTTDLTG
jgi:ABC-type anion transport system duplicated permease subunit